MNDTVQMCGLSVKIVTGYRDYQISPYKLEDALSVYAIKAYIKSSQSKFMCSVKNTSL
jgi:hypothetical protein